MEPWLIKLLLAGLAAALASMFGLIIWVVKKVFGLLTSAFNRAETNASKNLEMARGVRNELRALRAYWMGVHPNVMGNDSDDGEGGGVVGMPMRGDITPIQHHHDRRAGDKKRIRTPPAGVKIVKPNEE